MRLSAFYNVYLIVYLFVCLFVFCLYNVFKTVQLILMLNIQYLKFNLILNTQFFTCHRGFICCIYYISKIVFRFVCNFIFVLFKRFVRFLVYLLM